MCSKFIPAAQQPHPQSKKLHAQRAKQMIKHHMVTTKRNKYHLFAGSANPKPQEPCYSSMGRIAFHNRSAYRMCHPYSVCKAAAYQYSRILKMRALYVGYAGTVLALEKRHGSRMLPANTACCVQLPLVAAKSHDQNCLLHLHGPNLQCVVIMEYGLRHEMDAIWLSSRQGCPIFSPLQQRNMGLLSAKRAQPCLQMRGT